MPVYEFVCDECGHREEVICSMEKIVGLPAPMCPKCPVGTYGTGEKMRRIFGNGGIIFKDGAPGQDIRREKEDTDTQRQRRKAWILKERGDVPQEHVLGLKESDERFNRKYPESNLDKQYDRAVKEGE